MAERKAEASELCGEVKHGNVDVFCSKEPGHVKDGDLWHAGEVETHEERVISSDHLCRHTITAHAIERVEWADSMTLMHEALERLKPKPEQAP